MGLPPHDSGYHLEHTDAWIFYISAFVWIPYTLFTWYLYYEHKSRNQYPQYFIIQFLAMGCTCRTIWLFAYPYSNGVWMKSLSRLAMLLQFSAISLLMLMWDRALKVTRQMDKGVRLRNRDDGSVRETIVSRTLRLLAQSSTRMRATNESDSSVMSSMSEYELKRELDHDSLMRKRIAWVVINVIAYVVLIGSVITETSEEVYEINLCSIGLLCLLVDFGILKVGLSNYFRLRKELKPVFMNSSTQEASLTNSGASPTEKGKCRTALSYCCCGLDSFLFHWDNSYEGAGGAKSVLQMQAQVIRVLLWVSFTVAIFFLIRAFCFIFFPLDPSSVIFNQQYMVGRITYPLFLYQFPEFFPNIAIAIGISPPKGILRVWLWRIGEYKSQVMRDIQQKKWWQVGYWTGGGNESASAAAAQSMRQVVGARADSGKGALISVDMERSDVDCRDGGIFGRMSGGVSRSGASEDGGPSFEDDTGSRNESADSDAPIRAGAIRIPDQESTRMRNVSDALEEYIYTASSYASSYSTRGSQSVESSGLALTSSTNSPSASPKSLASPGSHV
jgi:hypothetical protein